MLPAEKTHYRKGLALGLTLAETFSVVVFILLLACAVLLRREQDRRNSAEAQRDTARIDLYIAKEMMVSDSISWANADAWFEYARELRQELDSMNRRTSSAERERNEAVAQAAAARALLDSAGIQPNLADSLFSQAARLKTMDDSLLVTDEARSAAEAQRDSLAGRVQDLKKLSDLVQTGIAEQRGLSLDQAAAIAEKAAQAERFADSLNAARRAIRDLDTQVRAAATRVGGDPLLDSLRRRIRNLQISEDTLLSKIRSGIETPSTSSGDPLLDSLRQQVRDLQISEDTLLYKLRSGIEPPPCWMDADDNPEYVFQVELIDEGMRLSHIAPRHRAEQDVEAMGYARQIEEGGEYSPADFERLTRPFLDLGIRRTQDFGPKGCRFWVHAVDRTGARKDIFKARLSQLERHFYKRWVSPPS